MLLRLSRSDPLPFPQQIGSQLGAARGAGAANPPAVRAAAVRCLAAIAGPSLAPGPPRADGPGRAAAGCRLAAAAQLLTTAGGDSDRAVQAAAREALRMFS